MSKLSGKSKIEHVDDLLPAFVNGTLNHETQVSVHRHLGSCEKCRIELAEWEAIASATRTFTSELRSPVTLKRESVLSPSGTSVGRSDSERDDLHAETARRPVSNRTLRTSAEDNSMQGSVLHPYEETRLVDVSRRIIAVAATIAFMIGLGGFALLRGPDRADDTVRLPAAMQASQEPSPSAVCDQEGGDLSRLALTGRMEHESVVMLPAQSSTEGRPGVDAGVLPTDGDPVNEELRTDIVQSVEGLVACMNADDPEGTIAWTTDDYWRRSNDIGIAVNPDKPRSFVPLVGPASGDTPTPEIENVVVFADGRVGAVIRPGFNAPEYTYDYYVFIEQEGRWLVDEAVHVTELATVEIVVSDEGYMPQEVVIPAAPSKLVVRNEGATPHSIVIPELLIRIEVDPGSTASANLKHPGGRFAFYSDVPGDDPEVFSGMLVIEGQPQATPEASTVSQEIAVQGKPGIPVASATITMRPPMEYVPGSLAILADRDVQITLVNDPSASNSGAEFLTPVSEGGFPGSPANFTIDALGISVDLAPGESRTIIVNAPAGTYAYYSAIPGHTATGMSGLLYVVEVTTPAP